MFAANLVSVIIPVYNTKQYLREAIESAVKQSHKYVEVIVIDDGSTDGSKSEITKLARQYARVVVIRQENSGQSAARNSGLAHAKGSYYWFLDSDDVLERNAIRNAVASLKQTGSDFTVAPYRMLYPGGALRQPGRWIVQAHSAEKLSVTLEDVPVVLVNQIACGKLFRASFWNRHELRFIEGKIFEDQYLNTQAYVRATGFDILTQPAIRWRKRAEGGSTTDQVAKVENLLARFEAASYALALLDTYSKSVRDERALQYLSNGTFTLGQILDGEEGYWDVLSSNIPALTDGLDLKLLVQRCSLRDRILYALILMGDRSSATALLNQVTGAWVHAFPTRAGRNGAFHLDVSGAIPNEVVQKLPDWATQLAETDLVPVAQITRLEQDVDGLAVHGFVYISNIDFALTPWDLQVFLRRSNGSSIQVGHVALKSKAANALSGNQRISYESSGFSVRIAAKTIDQICVGYLFAGPVELAFRLRLGSREYSGVFSSAQYAIPAQLRSTQATNTVGLSLSLKAGKSLAIQPAGFAGVRGNALDEIPSAMTVSLAGIDSEALRVRIGIPKGPIVSELSAFLEGVSGSISGELESSSVSELVYRFPFISEVGVGWKSTRVSSGKYLLKIFESEAAAPVKYQGIADTFDSAHAEVRDEFSAYTWEVTASREFELRISDSQQSKLEHWKHLQSYRNSSEAVTCGLYYFQCLNGEIVNDSQFAIATRLKFERPDCRIVWGVNSASVTVPAGHEAVFIGSSEYFVVLQQAQLICVNHELPSYFTKAPGQLVVQTFHGHPFKTMGVPRWRHLGFSESKVKRSNITRRQWDLLLASGPTASKLYKEAFPFGYEVVERGMPRNDSLVNADSLATRRRVRETLGVEEGETLVLFAPTWRDYLTSDPWRSELPESLDLASLLPTLPKGIRLLYRGHPSHVRSEKFSKPIDPNVIDVSRYREINDLILASDAAVLDYSSLRFDYALVGKPMAFFIPDYQKYFAVTPPLFDYFDGLPGPVCLTAEDVLAFFTDVISEKALIRWRAAIEAFASAYAPYDDGLATERVARELLKHLDRLATE